MDRKWLRLCGWMLLGMIMLSGCSENKNEEEAKNFVQNYCSVMQDAYARADLNIIGTMTTENEIKKLFPIIQALTATDNRMKTEIIEFKLKKAKVSGDKATVRTAEKWRFWWVDKTSGTITKPKSEESYKLEYNLVKDHGQWKVDFVKNLNE